MEQRKKRLPKDLKPPEHDTALFVRVRYLIWVESMINIGCHFGPDDLPMDVWDQLLALHYERAFVDRLVEQLQDEPEADTKAKAEAKRKADMNSLADAFEASVKQVVQTVGSASAGATSGPVRCARPRAWWSPSGSGGVRWRAVCTSMHENGQDATHG